MQSLTASRQARRQPLPERDQADRPTAPQPWELPNPTGGIRFVDLQNDVADKDIALAAREGWHSIEHVKRYTTLGMGTDQGKIAGPIGLALTGGRHGERGRKDRPHDIPPARDAGDVRRCRWWASRERSATRSAGLRQMPGTRARTPCSSTPGLWRRPQYYPTNGATLGEAYRAEAAAVRAGLGPRRRLDPWQD